MTDWQELLQAHCCGTLIHALISSFEVLSELLGASFSNTCDDIHGRFPRTRLLKAWRRRTRTSDGPRRYAVT